MNELIILSDLISVSNIPEGSRLVEVLVEEGQKVITIAADERVLSMDGHTYIRTSSLYVYGFLVFVAGFLTRYLGKRLVKYINHYRRLIRKGRSVSKGKQNHYY